MIELKCINNENFSRYGIIIEENKHDDKGFQIVLCNENDNGWRIAVLKIKSKKINRFGRHPDTMESFEPINGMAVMFVSDQEKPDECVAFILDRPVCLYKNIWHACLSLTDETNLKISESYVVSSEEYELEKSIYIGVIKDDCKK